METDLIDQRMIRLQIKLNLWKSPIKREIANKITFQNLLVYNSKKDML